MSSAPGRRLPNLSVEKSEAAILAKDPDVGPVKDSPKVKFVPSQKKPATADPTAPLGKRIPLSPVVE